MTEKLDRVELIGLLEALGGEQDKDVLSAARQIHAKVTAAGAEWTDLLVGDEMEPDAPASDAGGETDAETIAADAPDDAESLGLIERLLQVPGISESLREELEGYREDISEGEFEALDRKYLRSLHERMNNR